MKNKMIRQSVLGLTILFLFLMGLVLLHLGPVGWIASMWLSSLPMRFWGHDHFTIVGIWSWPVDGIGYVQAGIFWFGLLVLYMAVFVGLTCLGSWGVRRVFRRNLPL